MRISAAEQEGIHTNMWYADQVTAWSGETMINAIDGSEMIPIPAGEFTMGSDDRSSDEKPAHTVYMDTYEIGKYPVTVAQYRKFCTATGRAMPKAPDWGWKNNHPIVNVSWFDAEAYCKWAGGRLPTEAEWEKAAKGTDGRTYPWGDRWDKNKCANHALNLTSTAPVGSYPAGASPYGCMDMAGNVWEWCADRYDGYYYETSPSRNPKGSSSGNSRVLRGGGWDNDGDGNRCTYRDGSDPDNDWNFLGFRLSR